MIANKYIVKNQMEFYVCYTGGNADAISLSLHQLES